MAPRQRTVIVRLSSNARLQNPDVPNIASVETQDLNIAERAALAKDPGVLQAPAMAFSPVEPFGAAAAGALPPKRCWGLDMIGADALPETAGRGVKVAVLDTGIDPDHAAFKGMKLECANFTSEADNDTDGHGTHCAGTIFGRDVFDRRIGVARGVQHALIGKVMGHGGNSSEAMVRGIMWARNRGAHVISMSLGLDFEGHRDALAEQGFHPKEATSIALSNYRENVRLFGDIARLFAGEGVAHTPLIVAGAGNDAARPRFTIAVSPPASAEGIVAVGAIDPDMCPAVFSNTDPDVCAPGVEIWSARLGGGLKALSGTNMAAPHVAGVAALRAAELIAEDNFSPARLRERIWRDIRPLDDQSHRDVGSGLVRA